MKPIVLAAALLLAPSLAAAQAADPPRDAQHPPSMDELRIPSHGARMNGLIYLAQGAAPHPVAVFLHGYPGNERNLDLAQAVRRAGWDVLYFDYRGAWGSGGTFTFQNALDDVASAVAWLRDPANRAHYGIDASRIALVGHSMGGWLALMAAARDPRIACTAGLAPWNLGLFGRTAREHPERDPGAYFRQTTDPQSGPIRGNAVAMLRETETNAAAWDYLTLGPALRDRAVMLVAATHDDPDEADDMRVRMTRALETAGNAHVTSILYDDDHPFSAHRIELGAELVRWLNGPCAAVQAAHRD